VRKALDSLETCNSELISSLNPGAHVEAKTEAVLGFLAALLLLPPKRRRPTSTFKSPRSSSYRGLLNFLTHSGTESGGKKDVIQRIDETNEKEARDEQQIKSNGAERKPSISELTWDTSELTTEEEIALVLEVLQSTSCLLDLEVTDDFVDEVAFPSQSHITHCQHLNCL
jgi:hypothetical protein